MGYLVLSAHVVIKPNVHMAVFQAQWVAKRDELAGLLRAHYTGHCVGG